MSHSCQERTHAPQQRTCSLDHFVSALLEEHWHVEAERLGGLEVDHQLELDRSLNGKLARLLSLEDAIGIDSRAPKIIGQVNAVGQQAAEFSVETERIDGREAVASSRRDNLRAMADREGIWHHDQTTIRLASLCGNEG